MRKMNKTRKITTKTRKRKAPQEGKARARIKTKGRRTRIHRRKCPCLNVFN